MPLPFASAEWRTRTGLSLPLEILVGVLSSHNCLLLYVVFVAKKESQKWEVMAIKIINVAGKSRRKLKKASPSVERERSQGTER